MLLTALALVAVPQGQVHVVDAAGGPGSDFTTIGSAVVAAADGDVVLVRTGDYGVLFTFGKGLTVVADTGAVVRTTRLQVIDLPVTSQVLVQGLTVNKSFENQPDLDDNRGALWLERCNFELVHSLDAVFALWTMDSDAVVLSRCTLQAWDNDFFPSTALYSEGSRVHAFDSTLIGVGSYGNVDFRAAATLKYGSFLELFGSTVVGGDGHDSFTPVFACDGGAGGDTVSIQEASAFVELDSVFTPGVGGDGYDASCNAGADGREVVLVSGTHVALAGTARSLALNSPVREGEGVVVSLTGLPGDRVWLKYSLGAGTGISSRFYDGENMLGAQRFRALTTTLPASGTEIITVPAPQLDLGQESLVVFCQAFFLDAAGTRFVISSPSATVVLDASF